MKRIREERQVLLLYMLSDALLFWLALTLAGFVRLETLYDQSWVLLHRDRVLCLVIFMACAGLTGLYRPSVIGGRFDSIYYLLVALMAAFVTQFVVVSFLPADVRVISRREMLAAIVFATLLLTAWHYFGVHLVLRFRSLQSYFVVTGNESEARRIATEIRRKRRIVFGAEYMPFNALPDLVGRHNNELAWTDVVVALPDPNELGNMLDFCEQHFRRTFLYPALHDTLIFQHGKLLGLAGIPLIEVSSRQLPGPYLAFKRAMDVAVATVGILLALPIGLVTAAAVKLSSPGPVFYLQERLGRNGKPFNIVKFRSMRVQDGDGRNYVRAGKDDARITRVGRIIRAYKIDELPQLLNVLKGDMSLIGPRPLWSGFFQQNGEGSRLWERRLLVRPGLTSLSHVLGSSFGEAKDFLRYDLVYISTLSLMVDLRILVATVRIVLRGRGA